MKNTIFRPVPVSALFLAILCAPYAVFAQSVGKDVMIPMPPACRQLNMDLRSGQGKAGEAHADPEIRNAIVTLQDFLYSQQMFGFQSSGYFGPLTLAGVKKFQSKNGIPATGFVGPITRAKINAIMGCGGTETRFPVIFGAKGPAALNVGMTGTWTIEASDRQAGTLSYSVSWGDELPVGLASPSNASRAVPSFVQTSAFSHSYSTDGIFEITFTVQNETTKSLAQKKVTVKVSNPDGMRVSVVSPNGDEKWNIRSNQAISWSVDAAHANASSKVDLYLVSESAEYTCNGSVCPAMMAPREYVLDTGIAANATYYWIAGTDISDRSIPSGRYHVKVCPVSSNGGCDRSDKAFTLVDASY